MSSSLSVLLMLFTVVKQEIVFQKAFFPKIDFSFAVLDLELGGPGLLEFEDIVKFMSLAKSVHNLKRRQSFKKEKSVKENVVYCIHCEGNTGSSVESSDTRTSPWKSLQCIVMLCSRFNQLPSLVLLRSAPGSYGSGFNVSFLNGNMCPSTVKLLEPVSLQLETQSCIIENVS